MEKIVGASRKDSVVESVEDTKEEGVSDTGEVGSGNDVGGPQYNLAATRVYQDLGAIFPGASMAIMREEPTVAFLRVKAGSIEVAHHHTFGYDLEMKHGKKKVWNISRNQEAELGAGDYLYTPAGDVHRAYYTADTEFFIKWEGPWDFIPDEDLSAAAKAINGTQE